MSETSRPQGVCAVQGCEELAVNTPRSPAAAEVVDAAPGELVPLCAAHAEEADTPPDPPTT